MHGRDGFVLKMGVVAVGLVGREESRSGCVEGRKEGKGVVEAPLRALDTRRLWSIKVHPPGSSFPCPRPVS